MIRNLFRKARPEISAPKAPKADVFVISYPKSGRTWHRLLVGNYLAREAGVGDELSMQLGELCSRLGKPQIAYTHNGADMRHGYAPDDIRVASPEAWEGRKVVFLVRDVKDVLVSAYHHARYRRSIVSCDFETFVRSPNLGARKVLAVMDRWAGNSARASAHIVLRYEDMHADAGACLTRTLSFAGCGPVDAARVGEAVAFCTADNMRKLEQSNFFKAGQMRPGRDKQLGAKVRSASVGGHTKHMTADLAAYVDEMDAAMGFPLKRLIASDPLAAA